MKTVEEALAAVARGEAGAGDRRYALLYADLHRLAQRRLQAAGSQRLLDTTSLVHEAYLRLHQAAPGGFPDQNHFMAYAARAMRSVVVDLVRSRQAERRGGGAAEVTWRTGHAEAEAADHHADEVLRVHEALQDLTRQEPRLATVVELRYFGGLTESEVAASLNLTLRTVQRDWAKARLYLSLALQ